MHLLAEAAEIEHNLMCTYLYAAFSLKRAAPEFSVREAEAVGRWRRTIMGVAVEEMAHLAAVWNITSALGGAPRFGRGNFPLEPGTLPAGLVVKLAPFSFEALQHFLYLERPAESGESDGAGFDPEVRFRRAPSVVRLIPMPPDYETVGEFYGTLERQIGAFTRFVGEDAAFCGDPALQLSRVEVELAGVEPVLCSKTASAALRSIVEQGEGAPRHVAGSHFVRFMAIRDELQELTARNPTFAPAFPAAVNPVLRRPPRPAGRVWIEDERARATVDLANGVYVLMLRLLAYSYVVPRPEPEKSLAIDLSRGLMHAMSLLGERAASLPAGQHAACNAGMSFTAVRDAAALLPGNSTRRFFVERFGELAQAAALLDRSDSDHVSTARRMLEDLSARAGRSFGVALVAVASRGQPKLAAPARPDAELPHGDPVSADGTDEVEGKHLTVVYDGKRCIHARFCVTWGPNAFVANVAGPWIHPDAMSVDALVEIAHVCPSGAIRYRRKDGGPEEGAPPVNLIAVREAGPYAVRADVAIADERPGFRVTLCRCGASKRKPYCDGSHKAIGFAASGEPPSAVTDALAVRNGPLSITPLTDGPLELQGNLEIITGTGRVVARVERARLCRCGGSANKPFCDGTHEQLGFRSR